ncbi:uncharacterized protein J4E79_004658 [Alternaria viburni]|uniref:uncharacterized protein n=1 Tax=Alternaria viburni TaxID=566460 RepID=UPI0020C25EB0|nr:uncharacterized protein J4E79_004658 [Alternaria viburni]KAI4662369.1 hypothetical protein J4E79_004658 [Alternaria viburni]
MTRTDEDAITALENTTLNDLLAMDNTYRTRLQIRTKLLKQEHHEVLACNPEAVPAVQELYEWLIGTYLPQRFPSLYRITESGKHLRNHVTDTLIPLHMPNREAALEILGANIDTEFLLLTPSPSTSPPTTPTKYVLTAFVNCFPSGFNTRSKLGQLLADIHAPVPGYAAKLEKSMDRFFANLPVGKIVKRSNWSISTNGELFCLQGNHMSEEEMQRKQEVEDVEEIDLNKSVVRCERQTLHRLPKTGALVFAFKLDSANENKTYQYPLRELRDEGSGQVLAEAIDGLGLGSVPAMTIYKRQVVWGDKVKAFLRGEIDA